MGDELIALRLFKEDALERMANDERHIASLNERIEILEFHLGKLCDLLWHGYSATAGVLPLELKEDAKPPKKRAKNHA